MNDSAGSAGRLAEARCQSGLRFSEDKTFDNLGTSCSEPFLAKNHLPSTDEMKACDRLAQSRQ